MRNIITGLLVFSSLSTLSQESPKLLFKCSIKSENGESNSSGMHIRVTRVAATSFESFARYSLDRSFDGEEWENMFVSEDTYIKPQTDGSIIYDMYDVSNVDVVRFQLDVDHNVAGGVWLTKILGKESALMKFEKCQGSLRPGQSLDE